MSIELTGSVLIATQYIKQSSDQENKLKQTENAQEDIYQWIDIMEDEHLYTKDLDKSVILICDSSKIGVFGLQINGAMIQGKLLRDIAEKNKDKADFFKINNSENIIDKDIMPNIYSGGLHNKQALFMLHNTDHSVENEHLLVDQADFGVTQWTKETASLYYMYKHSILVAGYMFWTFPQFKSQLRKMYWMIGKVEKQTIFDLKMNQKWNLLLQENNLKLDLLGMNAFTI